MKKTLLLASLLCMANVAQASQALAVVQNAQGNVNKNIKVFAMFDYTIVNTTSSPQNYVGEEVIEVHGKKVTNPIYFQLRGNGSIHKSDNLVLNVSIGSPGEYKSNASIKIMGMGGAAHSTRGKVTVKP